MLASFPHLGAGLDVRRIAFPRPRADLIALIGEANQSLPVLVLAEDAPGGLATATHEGRGFVNDPMGILDVLHQRHGFPLRHP